MTLQTISTYVITNDLYPCNYQYRGSLEGRNFLLPGNRTIAKLYQAGIKTKYTQNDFLEKLSFIKPGQKP